MSIIIATIVAMGSKLLTAKVVESVFIFLGEELVKRTSSKADDRFLEIVKEGLK